MNPTPLSTTGLVYGNPDTDTEGLIIQPPIMTPDIRQVNIYGASGKHTEY